LDDLATWKDSFRAAGITLLYFIGWGIIGGFVSGLGIVGIRDPASSLYKGANPLQFYEQSAIL